MKQWNRILAVMLSLALVLSGFGAMGSPLKAQAAREITAVRTSTATEIDPSTLNGFRLAAIPEQNVAPDGHTYAPDEIVRVSIWLETPSVMDAGFTIQAIQAIAAGGSVADYREMLQRQQAEMAARISAAIGCELNVIWNLTLLNNTIAADVRFADIKAISQVEGVQSVNVDYVFQAEADGP
ncbi:MAG: hypothetical protein ILP12_06145, partial [Lachnospiraceae bacterium]|nr:hypothetical protein [Lachnospiraceae bacterium]